MIEDALRSKEEDNVIDADIIHGTFGVYGIAYADCVLTIEVEKELVDPVSKKFKGSINSAGVPFQDHHIKVLG